MLLLQFELQEVVDSMCIIQDIIREFFFQAEDGIRASDVTGVQTCALPIYLHR